MKSANEDDAVVYDGKQFGVWLRNRRKSRDLTQRELAEMIGCSEFTLRKFEAGTRRPSKQIVERLADFFAISQDEKQKVTDWARLGATQTQTPSAADDTESRGQDSNRDSTILRSTFRNPHPRPSNPNNLPSRLTRLIGREREVSESCSYLLRKDVRLLTLLGPPGVGKTRLSIQVASNLLTDFRDGVFFVELALVRDAQALFASIAQTLGYKQPGSQDMASHLSQVLRSKQMLLVLDNFEQVTEAAPDVVRLLESCPNLKILVTSREALRVRGEQQLTVPTLPLPDPTLYSGQDFTNHSSVERLMDYASITLFLERGTAVKPDFTFTAQNASEVAALCASLDGLPLAIELAAAHLNVLSPGTMLSLLDRRLALLVDGARDLPSRHQTLRAAIDWSYDLLSQQERLLFADLSVFAGGCTLPAIEAVCALDNTQWLKFLIDKSLLHQREGLHGALRYYMLETIREYAMERLEEAPANVDVGTDVEKLRSRLASYYLTIAEEAESHFNSEEQEAQLDRLEEEHDNLRSALTWTLSTGEYELAARIVGALWRFWDVRGYWSEGRRWLESVLVHSEDLTNKVRAKAALGAGRLAYFQDDNTRAKSFLSESLASYRQAQDKVGIAQALGGLAYLAARQGERDVARSLLEDSLAASRQGGDRRNISRTLGNLGRLAMEDGDYERATRLMREALSLFRELHDKPGTAVSLQGLGQLAAEQADYGRAASLLEESLAINRELADKGHIAWVLGDLGIATLAAGQYERSKAATDEALRLYLDLGDKSGRVVALFQLGVALAYQGDHETATSSFRENLELCLEMGDEAGCALGMEGLAFVAISVKNWSRAAYLLGIAEMLRSQKGYRVELIERPLYERTLDALQSFMDVNELEEAMSEGRNLSFEQSIVHTLRGISC